MENSVQSLYGLLIRSRLLAKLDAQAMFDRWQAEATDDKADTARFATWIVANKFITEYQASLLMRGHSEGFFLGPYKILDRLGRGRMAGVYRASDQLGQIVAIKVLPPSKAKDHHLLGRFQRESRLAIGLVHSNIVGTVAVGEEKGIHYLVMEYLEGETLEEILVRRGKLLPEEAAQIGCQALQGLQYLHERGMVHRDVKPANLMMVAPARPQIERANSLGLVKILDIGLARFEGDESSREDSEQPQLTTEGILLGTPDYMSPEQARDARSVDIRSDIYSLGCVLFHAIAGQPPFPDTNIISQMIRHTSEAPKPLVDFNPAVPDGLQQIINWMMAKEPSQRYLTPQRAAQALEVFLVSGSERNSETPANHEPSRKSESAEVDFGASGTRDENATMKPARRGRQTPTLPVATVASEKTKAAIKSGPILQAPSPNAGLSSPTTGKVASAIPIHETDEKNPEPMSASSEFDVDLIAPPQMKAKQQASRLGNFRLGRRDFFMFAVGSATVFVALAIGKLLARLFPQRQEQPPVIESENDSQDSGQ